MKQILFRLLPCITCGLMLVTSSGKTFAQPQASGGTINTGAPANKTATKPAAARKPAKKSSNGDQSVRAVTPTTGAATIDGKWWTTGNGFGDSAVVFTQTGTRISGVITYADGRTGTVTGTLVGKRLQHSWTNSSGDGGSGWLELSWSNFLGGPWRNQRVKDGSWTLRRIEGKWCFGGSRNRIRSVTHDANGRIFMITEDGTREEGHLRGPAIFLHGDSGDIEGEINYKSNRVDWSTGFFWTWCGR